MSERMTHDEIEAVRHAPGRSLLLFVTDRCPVGCAHCSVDSRADSPTITDFALFEQLVDALCAAPRLELVGISGGEPFAERRGLALASRRLAAAGKRQVVYTSGVWASAARTPTWIREVLGRCSSVYLSTDAFHASRVPDGRYVRAARAIADAGAWIVVQVLDIEATIEAAERLLRDAFGPGYAAHAELRPVPPLTHGRGAGVFTQGGGGPGHAFGRCPFVASPLVRYDGGLAGCCNESVVMGHGPERLRRRAGSGAELTAALDAFANDPLLRAIGGVGLGALTAAPHFADLAERSCANGCDLCWQLLDRSPPAGEPEPLLELLDVLVGAPGR
jgi:organic radical activating enzyme